MQERTAFGSNIRRQSRPHIRKKASERVNCRCSRFSSAEDSVSMRPGNESGTVMSKGASESTTGKSGVSVSDRSGTQVAKFATASRVRGAILTVVSPAANAASASAAAAAKA